MGATAHPYTCVTSSFEWAGFSMTSSSDWNGFWGRGNIADLKKMNLY